MQEQSWVRARVTPARMDGQEWVVDGATVVEELGAPYAMRLDLRCLDPDATPEEHLGQGITLELERTGAHARFVGVVTRVKVGRELERECVAHLTVQPALCALGHRRDSRIFQHLTVPQILARVIGGGLAPFGREVELRLDAEYPEREYTVQYQETDFDFVHRLMGEVGISYTFEHEGDEERLVLFDAVRRLPEQRGPDGLRVPFVPVDDDDAWAHDAIRDFVPVAQLTGNRVVSRHFDWTRPSVPLEGSQTLESGLPALEAYHHDAPLTFSSYDTSYGAHDGAHHTRVLAELQQRDRSSADAGGTALDSRAGRRFELHDHPRPGVDGRYTVIFSLARFGSHARRGYDNELRVLPEAVEVRPDRRHARPRLPGVQTATVVGPPGEEIHVDPHGRVKVQFHWDRDGANDDHSSCWIRVMQSMGGPGWGFSFVPRVGMEVVITFVDGDPDQPLVTGTVYNGNNPCPYELPADKTRMTIRSRSSPGGAGFNELRFEDRAGGEEIWLHGERDWNTLIKHDLTRDVGRHETQKVALDRTREVGRDESVTVANNQNKHVGSNETESVGMNRTRTVGAVETVTIGAAQVLSVGASQTVSVAADASVQVGASLTQTVGQNLTQTVMMSTLTNVGMSAVRNVVVNDTLVVGGGGTREIGQGFDDSIGEGLSQKVGADASYEVGGSRSANVTAIDTLMVGAARNVTVGAVSAEQVGLAKIINAGQSITFACGAASITLEASGKVSIVGTEIGVEGSDLVKVNGGLITLN